MVVDKTVRNKFKSDKEAKEYAKILLSLVSQIGSTQNRSQLSNLDQIFSSTGPYFS